MRKLILFLAAVSQVLFAGKALCHGTTFSIEPESFNSFRSHEMRAEQAAPLSIRTGRFLSVDPGRDWDMHQPQSWNMYAYVRNNPINRIDPTGRSCADPNFIGPCRPTAEATLATPRNAANWTAEQKAAENAKNAHRGQLAGEGQLVVNRNQARPSSAEIAPK